MRAIEKLLASKRLLAHISRDYAPVAMFQSLSVEDMVLAHLIYDDLVHCEFESITMFTIDTGRLPEESLAIMDKLRERFGDVLTIYHPDHRQLEQLENEHCFSDDYEQHSYQVRLMNPLKNALQNYNAWLTGSNTLVEAMEDRCWIKWDDTHQIPRFNPLSRWNQEEIWSYLKHHGLPVHGSMLAAAENGQSPALETALRWQNQPSHQWNGDRYIA